MHCNIIGKHRYIQFEIGNFKEFAFHTVYIARTNNKKVLIDN